MLRNSREEEALKRRNENACRLCGGEQYVFEPPVYYCNGKCNQKIRRSAFFYITPDNKQSYCLGCYNSCLRDIVTLEDGTEISKTMLKKKKNDETQEESWVECNGCKRWYHQICVLFNGRRNDQSRNEPYFCPICVLRFIEQLRKDRLPQPDDVRFSARDLPTTGYSDFLEKRVARRVQMTREAYRRKHKLPLSEVENVSQIFIRVVSCKETELFPRQGLERLYGESENYPKSFPHKVKCILLFEEIDGVDVLILALYTQVYGSDCPAPNTRTLYIAYLDSVYYFTPAFCRTPVYHELLESTLEYEKKRGITKTFIWVCPPLAGDDYILYCHPKDQKTPKADMLRSWYYKLLENCRKRGVVISMDNLYDSYLARVCNLSEVPNFDGDYWPGVTEQFIEQLESEKVDPKSIAPRKKRVYSRNKHLGNKGKNSKSRKRQKLKGKKQNKGRTKKAKLRRRSSAATTSSTDLVGADEPSVADENENDTEGEDGGDELLPLELTPDCFLPPRPLNLLDLPQQDALTVKIADVINQMKEDFMVVHLCHICASCCKDIDKPHEIYWLPEKYDPSALSLDYHKNRYAPPYALCDECYCQKFMEEFGSSPSYENLEVEKVGCWDEDFELSKGLGIGKDQDTQDEDNVKSVVQEILGELIGKTEESTMEIDVEEADTLFIKDENSSGKVKEPVVKEEGSNAETHDAKLKVEDDDVENQLDEVAETGNDMLDSASANQSIAECKSEISSVAEVKIKDEKGLESTFQPASSPKSVGSNYTQPEEIVTVLPPGVTAGRRSAWQEAPCTLLQMTPLKTNIAEETLDTDPAMDCQFFDSRQQFLSLCQGNRYQFDQLRRAKHSSMMILYHLHNPDLPSFIHSCNNCRMDIANGHRYSCRECDDFDLCEKCVGQVQHHHEMVCITDPNAPSFSPGPGYPNNIKGAKANGMMPGGHGYPGMNTANNPAYQQHRGLRVQAHMALLVHASQCHRQDCENKNCFRMRQLLQHGAKCPERAKCKICRRIWSLLHVHARQCRVRGTCSVPSCDNLRAHLRRVAAQSQDRRIRMHTQRMEQERVQAQQMQMDHGLDSRAGVHDDRQTSSPNVDLQRNAKQGGKNLR